jgi:CRP-like cAMP-binding protein
LVNGDVAEALAGHPLFSGIERGALTRLLSRIHLKVRHFHGEKIIAIQGTPVTGLVVILDGRVAASIESPDGKALLVETLEAPDLLAPALVFTPEPVMPVTLTAITAGCVVTIDRDDLEHIGEEFPSFYVELLRDVGEKFNFLTTKIRLLQFATLRQKVAGYLLERARITAGTTVVLPYGRERLAELFGVARPSLSRTLGAMVEEGLLTVSRNLVEIRDRAALLRTAQDAE